MTTSKQLSPVGYLNKVTGHIWTPTEQPDAADQPGIYEPLVMSREALDIALQAKCDALAAEADYLLPKAASELSNAWLLHRTMMGAQVALKCLERGEYSAAKEWLEGTTDEAQLEIPDAMATGELQKWFDENLVGLISSAEALKIIKADIPAADAAIAEIKAQGLDELAEAWEAIKPEDGVSMSASTFHKYQGRALDVRDFAANLRAGRKV